MTLFLWADFWGPVSNFGIPIAAVMDTQKDPEMCVFRFLRARFVRPKLLSFSLRLLSSISSFAQLNLHVFSSPLLLSVDPITRQ